LKEKIIQWLVDDVRLLKSMTVSCLKALGTNALALTFHWLFGKF
jgi:hypothetical protein